MDEVVLHRIRTDVLLWSLGAFAEPETRTMRRGLGWDEDQRRVLIEQVRRAGSYDNGWIKRGTVESLARLFGKTRHAVSREIYLLRRGGYLPPTSGPADRRTRSGLCAHGHPMADAYDVRGWLQCRRCSLDRSRAYKGLVAGVKGRSR